MIVAGGIYSETCVAPWSLALLGSGGRAALALTGLCPAVELHAFQPARLADEVYPNFEPFGVDVRLHPSDERIQFHYLHPLARPRISPIPLPTAGSISVSGQEILRFGCLEGDFRVRGEQVVYDPQTAVAPASFRENGSAAERLAIVLNRAELATMSGTRDMALGVRCIHERDGADTVVVKAGPRGAYVFSAGELSGQVPAFEATAIHKVGSGDTFSAAFAYYWMKGGLKTLEAVQLASLHTAEYVETRRPVLAPNPLKRTAKVGSSDAAALVAIGREGASASWLIDEALSGLWDLGVNARLHHGCSIDAPAALKGDEILFLLDPGLELKPIIASMADRRGRTIVYIEASIAGAGPQGPTVTIFDDLTTALYSVAWQPAG